MKKKLKKGERENFYVIISKLQQQQKYICSLQHKTLFAHTLKWVKILSLWQMFWNFRSSMNPVTTTTTTSERESKCDCMCEGKILFSFLHWAWFYVYVRFAYIRIHGWQDVWDRSLRAKIASSSLFSCQQHYFF